MIDKTLADALLQCSQSGIVIIDAVTDTIVLVNPAACIIFGVNEDELVGSKCYDWTCDGPDCPLLDDTCDKAQCNVDAACENFFKSEDYKEITIERNDGSIKYVIRYAFSFLWNDRRHVIESLIDITKQKEAEIKYKDIVQYAPAGMYEVNYITGKFVSVNDVMCEYTGYTREEMLEMSAFDLLTSEGKILFANRIQSLLNGEYVNPNIEYQIITKHGNLIWCELHIKYIVNEDGLVTGATCIVTEITARKKAELALMESKNKAQMYLDMAFNIFVALDVEGRISLINQAGCDVLGVDECFLHGEDWFKFVAPEERSKVREVFKDILSQESLYDSVFENNVVNISGEKRLIRWRNRVIKDDNGVVIGSFSSGEDITEERELEFQQEKRWDKIESRLIDSLNILNERANKTPNDISSSISKLQSIIGRI